MSHQLAWRFIYKVDWEVCNQSTSYMKLAFHEDSEFKFLCFMLAFFFLFCCRHFLRNNIRCSIFGLGFLGEFIWFSLHFNLFSDVYCPFRRQLLHTLYSACAISLTCKLKMQLFFCCLLRYTRYLLVKFALPRCTSEVETFSGLRFQFWLWFCDMQVSLSFYIFTVSLFS